MTQNSAQGQLISQRNCNIRCERGGMFVDLSGGGGYDPAVIGFANGDWKTNPNRIWSICSVPGSNKNKVVIKNTRAGRNIMSDGPGRRLRCELYTDEEEAAHWYLEGVDIGSIKDDSVVRFRNVKHTNCYMDLEASGTDDSTPFIAWSPNNTANQAFQLWKR